MFPLVCWNWICPEAIFVPIAFIATLSQQNLGVRNEGVWGREILELIGIF